MMIIILILFGLLLFPLKSKTRVFEMSYILLRLHALYYNMCVLYTNMCPSRRLKTNQAIL